MTIFLNIDFMFRPVSPAKSAAELAVSTINTSRIQKTLKKYKQ